jgi:hypothetical protein
MSHPGQKTSQKTSHNDTLTQSHDTQSHDT